MSCKVILSKDHDGRRLDRTIRSIWPALPLSAIMRALRKGEVRLNAVKAKLPEIRVSTGQELYVPWEEPGTDTRKTAYRGEVPVIWQGESVLLVNKPVDMLVQPDVKNGDSVITRVWGMSNLGSLGFSPAAVHRLDRNTTGILAVALTGESLRSLELLFKERLVLKRYLAIVIGSVPEKGLIEAPLEKDEENNFVRVGPHGKTARTRYRRLASNTELSLVSVELLTGRTHQARVHLAHIGHPILGDRKYGNIEINRRWKNSAKRPLLHAYELSFPEKLPDSIKELSGNTFRANIPSDMMLIIQKLGWQVSD